MLGINNYYSLISLNINGVNSPIKRYRVTDCIWKQDPTFCCIQGIHLSVKTNTTLEQKAGRQVNKQMVSGNKVE